MQATEAAAPSPPRRSIQQAPPPHTAAGLPRMEHLLAAVNSAGRPRPGAVIFDRAVIGLPDDVIFGVEGHERGNTQPVPGALAAAAQSTAAAHVYSGLDISGLC